KVLTLVKKVLTLVKKVLTLVKKVLPLVKKVLTLVKKVVPLVKKVLTEVKKVIRGSSERKNYLHKYRSVIMAKFVTGWSFSTTISLNGEIAHG
ncbi:MAG: hypothetical protein FWH27_12405, partial [Planctomycetaceae bacterium]|nr:hypothetical protein [Planctomycetaceae bacterium]